MYVGHLHMYVSMSPMYVCDVMYVVCIGWWSEKVNSDALYTFTQ